MKKKMFLGFALLITIVMPFNVNALVSEDITNAGAGETVTVDGENTENLNLNKSVTLKGDKEDKIIGDLTISGNNIDVVLDGFTLEGHINITAQKPGQTTSYFRTLAHQPLGFRITIINWNFHTFHNLANIGFTTAYSTRNSYTHHRFYPLIILP